MTIKGKVHIFGDNINTDDIIAATYLDSQDPVFLGSKCMENIDPDFIKRVVPGDIIVAGANFGCGSSREHAPVSLMGCGISLVIARSFARIFYRNCINVGLPILISSDVAAMSAGDALEVFLSEGKIVNSTRGKTFQAEKFPAFMTEIVQNGGLLPWIIRTHKKENI